MASVKKTMKSSKTKQANKTKQARQPASPKAKVSKQSAVLKTQRGGAARALASKGVAATPRKTKTKSAVVARRRDGPVAAKPAARKKASAGRVGPRASNTIRPAKKGATRSTKPALVRATGPKRGASARENAKSASGKTARPASADKRARGKPAAVPKKVPAIEVPRRVAAKPAAALRTAVESPTRTAQDTVTSKAAAILALKRSAARLSEPRKQAASPAAGRPAGNASKLDLASKKQVVVIKKSEQKTSTGSADPTDAVVAPVPVKHAAVGDSSQAPAKGLGKPFAAKSSANTLELPDATVHREQARRASRRAPRRCPNDFGGSKAWRENGSAA